LFLLSSIFPISMAILSYIFNKYHKIFILISYIGIFISLIISKTPQSYIPGDWSSSNGIEFFFDNEIKIVLICFMFFSAFIYLRFFKNKNHEFTLLWLILNGSLNSFFMSRDFFNIYVHIELISMIVFLILAMDKDSTRIWISLKYMLMSSVALNFYLIGVGMFYSNTGTLNITLSLEFSKPLFSQSFIITGLLIKSGVFFLSGWLPSAQSEASEGVPSILSGIVEKIGLWVIYLIFPLLTFEVKNFLLYFGIISAILSSIFTFLQIDLKKLLAYSTMTQMSYGLIIIAVRPEFFPIFLIYDMFSKGILFLLADDLNEKFGSKNLEKLKNVKISIVPYIIFFILLFNIGGVFPSNLYKLKSSLIIPLIIEVNIFIFGMYFTKLFKTFHISKKFGFKYLYLLLVTPVILYITYIKYNFEISKITYQYLLFFGGVIFYLLIFKKIKFKPINIYSFENSLIYQIAFLLIFFIIESLSRI